MNSFIRQEYPIYTNIFNISLDRKKIDENYIIYKIIVDYSRQHLNVFDVDEIDINTFAVAFFKNNVCFALFRKDQENIDLVKREFCNEVRNRNQYASTTEVNLFQSDEKSQNGISDIELFQLLINSLKNNPELQYRNITGELLFRVPKEPNEDKKNILEMIKFSVFDPNSYKNMNTQPIISANSQDIGIRAAFVNYSVYDPFYESKNKKSSDRSNGFQLSIFDEIDEQKDFISDNKLKTKGKEKLYLLDHKTRELRRATRFDLDNADKIIQSGDKFYKKGLHKNQKKNVKRSDFLHVGNSKQFFSSKVGLLSSLIADIKEYLSDYLSIYQKPIFNYVTLDDKHSCMDLTKEMYKNFFSESELEFSVVDTIHSASSQEIQSKIIELLQNEFNIPNIKCSNENKGFIVKIIHNKDYFEKLKLPDNHKNYSRSEITQNVTLEDFKPVPQTVTKIVQELIIKSDISNGELSLVNWKSDYEWNFVSCGEGIAVEDENCNCNKTTYIYPYYKLQITREGKLIFTKKLSSDIFLDDSDEFLVFDDIFNSSNNSGNRTRKNNKIQLLFYKDLNEIYKIFRTEKMALPALEKLYSDFSLSDDRRGISVCLIQNLINEFQKVYSRPITKSLSNALSIINSNIQNCYSNTITIKNLLNSINMNSVRPLVKFINEKNLGFMLFASPRSKENISLKLNAMFDIKLTKVFGEWHYCVGLNQSMNDHLSKGFPFRLLKPEQRVDDKSIISIFKDIAKMMMVQFVRNGSYTVLPFPAKYLNEYMKMNHEDIDEEDCGF